MKQENHYEFLINWHLTAVKDRDFHLSPQSTITAVQKLISEFIESINRHFKTFKMTIIVFFSLSKCPILKRLLGTYWWLWRCCNMEYIFIELWINDDSDSFEHLQLDTTTRIFTVNNSFFVLLFLSFYIYQSEFFVVKML